MRKKLYFILLTGLCISGITLFYTACKKQHPSQSQQHPINEMTSLDLIKKNFEAITGTKNTTTSRITMAEPSNPNNILDWIGIEHNQKLKAIIHSVQKQDPTIEDYYISYKTMCSEQNLTPKSFGQLESDLQNYSSRVYVFNSQNNNFTINADMFTSPDCSASSNAIVRYFIRNMYETEDYNARRLKSLQAEDIILGAGDLSDQEKAVCLSMITLFKWSDYYWSVESTGPQNYTYPGPAYWDAVWIKSSIKHADEMSPLTQNPSGFMLDCIGYTALMSSLFDTHFGI